MLAAFSVQVEATALSATQKRQDTIKEALIAYLRTHRRLPCPETTALNGSPPTGAESRGTSNPPQCLSFWGTLPFTTLGLSRDTALDGYGNYFTYYVSAAAINSEPDWTLTSRSGVPGFNVGNPGRFAITERIGAALVPTTNAANLAAAVIVSHGKNGSGAFTLKGTRIAQPPAGSDERTATPNTPPANPPAWVAPGALTGCGSTCPTPGMLELITKDHTDGAGSPGGAYDDIVLVLRPNDLLGPIIRDEALKSAEALVQEQLAIARDFAITEMLASNCTPKPSLNATLPIDLWGSPIQYKLVQAQQMAASNQATLATTPAFQIWSVGPDQTDDSSGGTLSGDDISLSTSIDITYGQILSRISVSACP